MKEHQELFVMAAGGTGGHVMPALAVAGELGKRGHRVAFIGTRHGLEARLAPVAGYRLEFIGVGGLVRVGWRRATAASLQLPAAVARAWRLLGVMRPAAVFSMGGYVAGPVVLAAWLRGIPVVTMEPNAVPGFTNRLTGRLSRRILLGTPEAEEFFPGQRCRLTGVPVREEFFTVGRERRPDHLTVLITGGSQGSRTLNDAFRRSWPLFQEARLPLRLVHQSGPGSFQELCKDFAATNLDGEVVPFIADMPAAFAAADLVVCRAGASTVAELAASGKPSILVPYPFAAGDHQRRNAEAMQLAGAAVLVPDGEFTGRRLFEETAALVRDPSRLNRMSEAAARRARPGSAALAAAALEEVAGIIDSGRETRNNTR